MNTRYLVIGIVILTIYGCKLKNTFDHPEIENILDKYESAFKESNYDSLRPYLSDTFKINEMRARHSALLFKGDITASNYASTKIDIDNYAKNSNRIIVVNTIHHFEADSSKKIDLKFAKENNSWKLVQIMGDVLLLSNITQTMHIQQIIDPTDSDTINDTTFIAKGKMAVKEYYTNYDEENDEHIWKQLNKVVGNDTINKKDKEGSQHGYWELTHPDGSFRCKGNYYHGKKEGYWERKYQNGNWRYQINYKKGLQHGQYKSYYQNGNIEKEGTYYEGLMNGLIKVYRENGVLEYEAFYLQDKKDGVSKLYNEKGFLIAMGSYKEGNRDGHWFFYDQNQQINSEVIYDNGKVIGIKKGTTP